MDLRQLFEDCAEITKSKGFDVTNYPAQVLLMGTELGEALENLVAHDEFLRHSVEQFIAFMRQVEYTRSQMKWKSSWYWASDVTEGNISNFMEELADLQIRLGSFIAGNDLVDDFENALTAKMEVNRERPYLHGKEN